MDEAIRHSLAAFSTRMAVLAVLAVGLILVLRRRSQNPGRPRNLALAGLAVLFVTTVAGAFANLSTLEPLWRNESLGTQGEVVAAAAFLLGFGNVLGLSLLVAAVVSRVAATDAETER